MNPRIRPAIPDDAELLSGRVSNSFADVALRFSLTPTNCPKHPSNCQPEWIRRDLARGVRYFIAERDSTPCGCVALEAQPSCTAELKRLAVLPSYRRHGIGRSLVHHALATARDDGAQKVALSIIAGHIKLREWYVRLGFEPRETRTFPTLPFDVLFMQHSLR